MSVFAIVLMWGWFAVALALLGAWPGGKEGDKRQHYWAKYEGK